MNRYCLFLLLAGMAVSPALAQELSAQELFKKVSPSVVVIEVFDDSLEAFKKDPSFKTVASGSGVVIPDRDDAYDMVATNCHLVDRLPSAGVRVLKGGLAGVGVIYGRNADMDLCLIKVVIKDWSRFERGGEAVRMKLPAVRVASSQWLEVGDPVYAIGAPQGLELTLSNGLVSGIREYKGTEYIQTTAPISQGSSGGGLFDAQGRLVGITTMYLKDGQNLNFAIPAELIASVSEVKEGGGRSVSSSQESEPRKSRDRWLTAYRGGDYTISLDTQSSVRRGRNVTTWEKFIYKNPQRDRDSSGKDYIEKMLRVTYYCGAGEYSRDKIIARDVGGDIVGLVEWNPLMVERTSVMPETVGESVYEAACNEL